MQESLRIEGIERDPTPDEMSAAQRFMDLPKVSAKAIGDFQSVIAPGKPLRDRAGMNVRVGSYVAPLGGPDIPARLNVLLDAANAISNSWVVHCDFETLHPYMDGNGRTGRILWAWQMRDADPFALPFLHRFYYQTLRYLPQRTTS